MKKLINGVDNVVDEMLNGMTAAFPQYIERVQGTDVVARTGAKKTDKVVLISGGGSGHEPAHGGYVGRGMLDAAVAGAVFTSPTPDQVYEAIKATECGKGALLIIKNYTGDVMNFEMAADMAADEDIVVEKVIVADDVAVENSTWTTGRRAWPSDQSRDLSPNASGGLTPLSPPSELQEIPVATREQSGLLCFHSR